MSPEEIRARRLALGWSQTQLAAAAGTNQQNIDRLERGAVRHARAMPAIEAALRRAAGALPASYDVDPRGESGSPRSRHLAPAAPRANVSADALREETESGAALRQAPPASAAAVGQTDLWAPKAEPRATQSTSPDPWRGLRPVYPVLNVAGGLRVSATPCDLVAPPPFLLPVADGFGLLLESDADNFGVGDLLWISPSLPPRAGGPGLWLGGPLDSAPRARLFATTRQGDAPTDGKTARIVAVYFRR
jgi:transcriptional regulator with XRE-family HTH domain